VFDFVALLDWFFGGFGLALVAKAFRVW